jgi:hypothetical protein
VERAGKTHLHIETTSESTLTSGTSRKQSVTLLYTLFRPSVPVTTPKDDGEEFDVLHIYVVCIQPLDDRRGNDLMFMTHFDDNNIPPEYFTPCESALSHPIYTTRSTKRLCFSSLLFVTN